MISIFLKKNLIKFSRCILILITYCLSLTSNTYSQTPPDLPAACLPVRFRMLDVAPNDNVCHCPPQSYCNQTVNFNGKTYQKLPGNIKKICCPAPTLPPVVTSPPISVTTNPPSKECDVHYFKPSFTTCRDKIFIGPRTARLCTKYSTTNPAQTAHVNSFNSCITSNCQSIRSDIFTKDVPSNMDQDTAGAVDDTIYTWSKFQEYAKCVKDCYDSNSLSSLINGSSDESLINWTLLPGHDNDIVNELRDGATDLVASATGLDPNSNHPLDDYIAANDPSYINHFTPAKFYGPLSIYGTLNQTTFPNFLNNTWNPQKLGHNYAYRIDSDVGVLDLFDVPPAGAPTFNLANYYVNKLQDASYNGNLSAVAADPPAAYTQPALPAGVTCTEYSDLNVCITLNNSNGSCDTCLSPDTKVSLADGSSKPIKELAVGDTVKSSDGKTAIIERVVKLDWKALALYSINDGALKLTADHPVMTTKGWRSVDLKASQNAANYKRYGLESVDTLQIGDVIVTETGNITVSRIMPEPVIKNGISYNLKLKGADSFYANNILVRSQH